MNMSTGDIAPVVDLRVRGMSKLFSHEYDKKFAKSSQCYVLLCPILPRDSIKGEGVTCDANIR